jgi:protease-4
VKYKKPVVVSYGDMSASGGVFSTCNADYIIANAATLTGSIGVFGGKVAVERLLKNKLNINVEPVAIGDTDNGGMYSMVFPFNARQAHILNDSIDRMYHDFVSKVASGRKLPWDTVEKKARGRVYTGEQALAHSLIDRIGGLHTAIEKAKEMLPEKDRDLVYVQQWPPRLGLWEMYRRMSQGLGGEDAERDYEPLFDNPGAQQSNELHIMMQELQSIIHAAYQVFNETQLSEIVKSIVNGNGASIHMKADNYKLTGRNVNDR